MVYQEPTFEEYKRATKLEKYANRISSVIIVLTWIALTILIIWMINHYEVIKNHPLEYGAEKENVSCTCYNYKEGTAFKVGNQPNLLELNYSNREVIQNN